MPYPILFNMRLTVEHDLALFTVPHFYCADCLRARAQGCFPGILQALGSVPLHVLSRYLSEEQTQDFVMGACSRPGSAGGSQNSG